MSPRRLKLVLTLGLCTLLLGYWGFYDPAGTADRTPLPLTEEIDGYLLDARAVEYDTDGLPKRTLDADRITHYVRADRTLLQGPDITLFREQRSPMRVRARQGEVFGADDEVLLKREVRVTDVDDPQFRLETDSLRLEPDRDYGETDAPVMIYQRSGQVRSIGMRLYFDEDRIQLLQAVRGVHEPN